MGAVPILEVLGNLGPLIVAIMVAYIAWRQWRTSHEKLKLDLHQKRFEIWEGFEAVRAALQIEGHISDEVRIRLAQASRETKFFFDDKRINELADELWMQGWTSYTCWYSSNRAKDEGVRALRYDEYETANDAYLKAHKEWTELALEQMRIRH